MDGGLCRKKILTTIPIIRIRLIFYMKNRLYNCCKFRFYPKTYYSLIGTPEAIRGGEDISWLLSVLSSSSLSSADKFYPKYPSQIRHYLILLYKKNEYKN